MFPRLLTILTAALAAAPAAAQPVPRIPLPFPDPVTAFPDIQPPARGPNGQRPGFAEMLPLIVGSTPRAIPAEAPTRRKLQIARLNGLAAPLHEFEQRIMVGRFHSREYLLALRTISDAAVAGADLEETPAGQVPWLEERLLAVKQLEWFTTVRVETGAEVPFQLNGVRAWRYGAEIDLLRTKELAAREAKRPQAKPPAPDAARPPTFTTFPDLKTLIPVESSAAEWLSEHLPRTVGTLPIPTAPGDSTRQKLLTARLNAGRLYLYRAWRTTHQGTFKPGDYPALLDVADRVALVGAALEETAADRVSWLAERVRLLWVAEQYAAEQERSGTLGPWALPLARAARLAAEIDLMDLKDRIGDRPAGKSTVPPPERAAGAEANFTAYPEILPQKWDPEQPGKFVLLTHDTASRLPRGEKFVRAFPDDATTLLKLQISRANDALWYCHSCSIRMAIGAFMSEELPACVEMLALAMRCRAEVEPNADERTRWHAAWVLEAKAVERFVEDPARVGAKGRALAGNAPEQLDFARFHRLGAEVALYDLEHRR